MSSLPPSERRESDRWIDYAGQVAAIEGRMAKLVDVSKSGAKVACNARFGVGDVVCIDLPWDKTVRGTVLSCESGIIRIQFAFEIEQPY